MSDSEPAEDKLYRDSELAQFYDLDNEWGPDLDYCARLATDARSVLDVGCGTGRLLACLADGRSVVGVEPAAAMLEIARQRPGGQKATWVHSEAQTVRLDRRFDLVQLTGHAFQVFLTKEDQEAVLSTIARHLVPGGRFIFDSRNPAAEEWREWTPDQSERHFEHPKLGTIKAWNDAVHDAGTSIVTYGTYYQVLESGQRFSASSKIRFTEREDLAALLDDAGLAVDQWLGDWHGAACDATSPDFIPIGGLR